MSKLDSLILLINSMDSADKRYFGLHSPVYEGEKDYRLLYHIILRSNLDADLAKSEFMRKRPGASFEITCAHLYKALLDKLSAKDTESEPDFQLLQAYQQARFLFKRNLCRESLQIIHKYERIALEFELFAHFLLLAKLEIQIYNQLEFDQIDEDDLIRKQAKIESVARQQRAIENHTGLYHLISIRQAKQGIVRNEEEKSKLSDLAFNELQAISGQNKNSFEAQKLHLLFQSAYFMKTANPKSSLKVYYELNELFEKNQKLWSNSPFFYVNHIKGILNNLRWFGNYSEMGYFIGKLRALSVRFPSIQNSIEPLIFIFESLVLTDQKMYAEAFDHLNNSFDRLAGKQSAYTFTTQAEIAFQASVVYFWNRNFKLALKVIRPILNAAKPLSQLPQTKSVRFMNLLIHCEQGDSDYIESETRSIERDLKKKGKLLKSEELILKCALLLPEKPLPQKNREKLQKQTEILRGLKTNPFERQLLGAFDYISWLESHINGK